MKRLISCTLIVLLTLHFCLPPSGFSLSIHADDEQYITDDEQYITDGDYYIQNLKSGLYLDVKSGSSNSGANVQLWSGNTNPQQKWQIKRFSEPNNSGPDYYVVKTFVDLNKGLDVYYNYQSPGSNVDIWPIYNPQYPNGPIPDCCKWLIELNDDGTVFFISYASGSSRMYLDAAGGGTTNGTNVIQSSYNGNPSMRWVLEPVNPLTISPDPYENNWDLIDSGGHIDWDGNTKYQTYFNNAVSTWNQSAGRTVIRPDSASVIQDIKIYDVNWSSGQSSSIYALTYENGDMAFNKAAIDSLNDSNAYVKDALIEHVMLHELGHALGLKHTVNQGDVMLLDAITSYIHPSRYDKENLVSNLNKDENKP